LTPEFRVPSASADGNLILPPATAKFVVCLLFKHDITLAYIIKALKTWRKKNGAMILAAIDSGFGR
jgi:hypothetical protein